MPNHSRTPDLKDFSDSVAIVVSSCDAFFAGATPDASIVYFNTSEQLDGADTDSSSDLYSSNGGTAALVSIGPAGGPSRFSNPAPFSNTSDARRASSIPLRSAAGFRWKSGCSGRWQVWGR